MTRITRKAKGQNHAALHGRLQLLVLDRYPTQLGRFTSDGTFVGSWTKVGNAPGFLWEPNGLCVTREGSVLIVSGGAQLSSAGSFSRPPPNVLPCQLFRLDGSYIGGWGGWGNGAGDFLIPSSATVDADGRIFVGDAGRFNIQKFALMPSISGAVAK